MTTAINCGDVPAESLPRIKAALRGGYLQAPSANPDDPVTIAWDRIATAKGFPTVVVTPFGTGMLVSSMIERHWPASDQLMAETRALIEAQRRKHPKSVIESYATGYGLTSGPFPPSRAYTLAKHLARVTGCDFPIPDAEVTITLREEADPS